MGERSAAPSGFCVEPLVAEPWILDVDTTIKPLYGRQEGAVLGYNPKKPGRPSHCYHTYSMASTRLVLDVDVCAGDEHTSKHGAPSLWALLDRLPRDLWPALLRGDCGFGNEGVMREAEARGLPYLFKLRLTKNVRRMIEKLSGREWVNTGQGFWAKESVVRLEGWSRARSAIVLRRRLTGAVGLLHDDESGAPQLSFVEIGEATEVYEYSVLVTSLDETTEAFGQLYRDRGDGDIDQAWRLSRLSGGGGGFVGGFRRQTAPGRRGGPDRLQRRDRLGIGAHEHAAFRGGADVAAG
jgi:Transposase DDE domain group 1